MHHKQIRAVDSSAVVDIFNAGVGAADAEKVVCDSIRLSANSLEIAGETFEIERLQKIIVVGFVVGFGKCSGAMAAGFEAAMKELPGIELSGLVTGPGCSLREVPSIQNALNQAIQTNDCHSFFAGHGSQLSPPAV